MDNNNFMDYLAKLMKVKDIISYYNFIYKSSNTEINNYQNEVNTIENIVKESVKNSNNISFDEYIKRLDEIIKNIEDRYQVSELISEYLNTISEAIDNISTNNYEEIVTKIKKLIAYMEYNKVYDLESNSTIIDEVSKVIYQGLLSEAIIGRNSILNEVLNIHNPIVKEKIILLLGNDINKLPIDDRMDIELNYFNSQDSVNDLNSELIKKIGDSVYSDKCVEFRNEKQTALMELLKKNDELVKENKRAIQNYNYENSIRKSLIKDLRLLRLKILSLIMIPIMSAAVGGLIAAHRNSDTLHKTVTKSYDMNTNKPIGDEIIDYENASYNYKINIKRFGPWIKKELGTGYMREVLEYNYTEYDDNKELDIESVLKNIEGKNYVEETNEIVENDEIDTFITETTMDKSDSQPNVRLVVLITLLSLGAGALTDVLLLDSDSYKDVKESSDIGNLKKRIKESKVIVRRVIESFERIGNKVVKLQQEFDKQTLTYGDLEKQISPELIETAKKYVKR